MGQRRNHREIRKHLETNEMKTQHTKLLEYFKESAKREIISINASIKKNKISNQ